MELLCATSDFREIASTREKTELRFNSSRLVLLSCLSSSELCFKSFYLDSVIGMKRPGPEFFGSV